MWKRFFAYLKALLAAETKLLDDPERLLEQAQIQMREAQVLNRQRAVEAVTARNNLQQQCAEMRKRIDALTGKINEAERSGDKEKAEKLRRESDKYEETLFATETQLARANEMIEQVKIAMQREEEKARQKTAEALELKSEWKQTQIGNGYNVPQQNDATIKWVFALIVLCLLALLILRTVG